MDKEVMLVPVAQKVQDPITMRRGRSKSGQFVHQFLWNYYVDGRAQIKKESSRRCLPDRDGVRCAAVQPVSVLKLWRTISGRFYTSHSQPLKALKAGQWSMTESGSWAQGQ